MSNLNSGIKVNPPVFRFPESVSDVMLSSAGAPTAAPPFFLVLKYSVSVGIMLGLVVGKPLGIWLFSRIMVALNFATLPKGINWTQVFGIGILAGIGFTMSIFTTNLAFSSPVFQDIAKISILASMVISLVLSVIFFFRIKSAPQKVTAKRPESAQRFEIDLELT